MRVPFSLFVLGFIVFSAAKASVPLAGLEPQNVVPLDPNLRNPEPRVLPPSSVRTRQWRGIQFVSNAKFTYDIPGAQSSFSGVIVYRDVNSPAPYEDPSLSNRLYVQLLLDEKPVFEALMDDVTPPELFSIPVAGAHRLQIVSYQEYSWDTFALFNAEFSLQRHGPVSSHFLPSAGKGFLDFMPTPEQALFHVFRPGEQIPVTVCLPQAGTAEILLRITPEQTRYPVSSSTLRVTGRESGLGGFEGSSTWTISSVRGPALLEAEIRVDGNPVFERKLRIAILEHADLSTVPNSTFGIHTSSAGFIRLQDQFASLWGAKWDRVFVRWEIIERNRGQYDFSSSDAIVDSLLAQHMRVLGVLGEKAPTWIGTPVGSYGKDWNRFVSESVQHYRNKIQHWDIFNEIDVKREHMIAENEVDPEFDVRLLASGLQTVHSGDPQATVVCCSTGTTPWLLYDKRIFEAGLLPLINIVSLHPYERTAPEEKDGVFDYKERLQAVDSLVKRFGTGKPIWSTEANWILGPGDTPNVTAPDLDEHRQAEYIVRVNIISWAENVSYFLHSPFYHSHRKNLHLDSLAAYRAMTFMFSGAGQPKALLRGSRVYGYAGRRTDAVVGALWTVSGKATVEIDGASGLRLFDFYGNPLGPPESSVPISKTPLYFLASPDSSPSVRVVSAPPEPAWITIEPVEHWSHTKESEYRRVANGVEVTSRPTKYSYQLRSPTIPVEKNSCYINRLPIRLEEGSVMLFALDMLTQKRVDDPVYISYVPEPRTREAHLRFQTRQSSSVQLVVADANLMPALSRFVISNPIQIASCPE